MSFSPKFRLATFKHINNSSQMLDFTTKNGRDIKSSLPSGGREHFNYHNLTNHHILLFLVYTLWFYFFNNKRASPCYNLKSSSL